MWCCPYPMLSLLDFDNESRRVVHAFPCWRKTKGVRKAYLRAPWLKAEEIHRRGVAAIGHASDGNNGLVIAHQGGHEASHRRPDTEPRTHCRNALSDGQTKRLRSPQSNALVQDSAGCATRDNERTEGGQQEGHLHLALRALAAASSSALWRSRSSLIARLIASLGSSAAPADVGKAGFPGEEGNTISP